MATIPILEYVNSLPLDIARDANSVIYGANAGGDTKIPCNKLVSEWSTTHQYAAGETTVTATGKFYYALQANVGLDPTNPANAAYWQASLGSGTGSGGNENFLANPLHDANLAGWVATGNCAIAYSTTRDLWDGGAMAITKTAGATGTVTGDLSEIMATQVGKAWLSKINNYIDAGATLAAGDIYFELFDGTNVISIADSSIILSQLVTQAYPVFPTNVIGSTWKLRIQFKSAAVCVMRVADCSVASQIVPMAAGSSGKIPWTPVLSTGAIGTATENVAYWQRNLDNMMASWRLNQTGGTAGSGDYLVTVPDGKSIDLTKKPVGSILGYGKVSSNADENSPTSNVFAVVVKNATQLQMLNLAAINAFNGVGSGNFPLSGLVKLSFDCTIPISQWSTPIQVSAECNRYYTIAASPVESLTGTQLSTLSTGNVDITVPVAMLLTDELTVELMPNGSGKPVQVEAVYPYIKASNVGIQYQAISATQFRVTLGATADGTTTWASLTNAFLRLRIKRGGSLSEVPPVVRIDYQGSDAAAINVPINFPTKIADTHLTVTVGSGTWKWTALFQGVAEVQFLQTATAGHSYSVYKNGAAYRKIATNTGAGANTASGSMFVPVNDGDYLDIRNTSGTNAADAIAWIQIVLRSK